MLSLVPCASPQHLRPTHHHLVGYVAAGPPKGRYNPGIQPEIMASDNDITSGFLLMMSSGCQWWGI